MTTKYGTVAHVSERSLIHLQFIYNAVAANCVEVATHRHGCCVLQRCVDHASDHQRVQLVNEITFNALTLVQDPYGNYVGSFNFCFLETGLIDVNRWSNTFWTSMITASVTRSSVSSRAMFVLFPSRSSAPTSSKRYFEWNQTRFANFRLTLISQCIRVAEHGTRKLLIGEMLNRSRLEKLLRDSYGNYCVQVRGHKKFGIILFDANG